MSSSELRADAIAALKQYKAKQAKELKEYQAKELKEYQDFMNKGKAKVDELESDTEDNNELQIPPEPSYEEEEALNYGRKKLVKVRIEDVPVIDTETEEEANPKPEPKKPATDLARKFKIKKASKIVKEDEETREFEVLKPSQPKPEPKQETRELEGLKPSQPKPEPKQEARELEGLKPSQPKPEPTPKTKKPTTDLASKFKIKKPTKIVKEDEEERELEVLKPSQPKPEPKPTIKPEPKQEPKPEPKPEPKARELEGLKPSQQTITIKQERIEDMSVDKLINEVYTAKSSKETFLKENIALKKKVEELEKQVAECMKYKSFYIKNNGVDTYETQKDIIKSFINDTYTLTTNTKDRYKPKDVFEKFIEYSAKSTQFKPIALDIRKFCQKLADAGIERIASNGTNYFIGLKLLE